VPKSVLLAVPHDAVKIDHLANDLMRLQMIKNMQGELKKERTALEAKIKTVLGSAEVGLILDEPAVTYRRSYRTAVSDALVKTLYPWIVPNVQETTEVRTLLLVA
jgi:hypothetical protein